MACREARLHLRPSCRGQADARARAKGEDDEHVEEIVRTVESHGGEVCFVRLHCTPRELGRRVANRSRRKIGKLTSRSALAELGGRFDLTSEVPFAGGMSLDTTKASPEKVSAAIAKHFGLSPK